MRAYPEPVKTANGQSIAHTRWRRRGIGLAILVLALAAAAVTTAPAALVNTVHAPRISGDLDQWLAGQERTVSVRSAIIPNTEKHIHWFAHRKNSKTRYSIVYLHGFSATRQEIEPVATMVADALGANLFETRLTGHGLVNHPLSNVRAEDWLEDAAEALAVGAALGKEIILIGTSTGATLALSEAGKENFDRVRTLVLISPNFAPKDWTAEFLTWPGGRQLAYMLVGRTRSWTPHNELQGRYWSTSYPTDALIEMMRLVKYVRGRLPIALKQSLLTIYSPQDRVIDAASITAALAQINSPRSKIITIASSGDPGHHVLAGNILSPGNNQLIAGQIIRFISSGNP